MVSSREHPRRTFCLGTSRRPLKGPGGTHHRDPRGGPGHLSESGRVTSWSWCGWGVSGFKTESLICREPCPGSWGLAGTLELVVGDRGVAELGGWGGSGWGLGCTCRRSRKG